MISKGFKPMPDDPALMVRGDVWICIYVDDVAACGPQGELTAMWAEIEKRFTIGTAAEDRRLSDFLGMRVKFYYTVRELSNHCAEIWAMRQLGDEVYARPSCHDGEACGGAAWLQEQLGSSYAPAWFDQLRKPNGADAAIVQAGTAGRWLNYYIEGLRHSVAESPHIK